MVQSGLPIIISAPSGAGKTTVRLELKKYLPDLGFSVSHTTRAPRAGEIDGTDYHFISKEKFLEMTQKKEFLEWAEIHNNYYGTARNNVESTLNQGKDLILELDVQGVESLRKIDFPGVYIFILPPSIEELKKRLNQRGTESADQIQKRFETGRKEILKSHKYEYLVTNTNVQETVDTILAIIRAEKCRTGRYHTDCPEIREILKSKVK